MRDWRGIKAMIGDRVFYVTVDSADKPEIHEAWVEEADESHVLVPARLIVEDRPLDRPPQRLW